MNIHQLSIERAPRLPIPPPRRGPVAGRVLVVEQRAATAEMALLVLAAAGYDAVHAATGTEALTLTPQWLPDLVLLDVLPDLSGVELCVRLRAQSAVPLMIVSAETDPAIIDLAFTAGACDYLPKPFRTAELLTRIHARLGR